MSAEMDRVTSRDSFNLGPISVAAAARSYLVYAAWAVALAAMTGSLYFSEIRGFSPCTLCWYQRILMYPLTLLLAVGILRRDQGLFWTVLPLSLAGIAVATYHNLLQQGVISESINACRLGASCQLKWIEWVGFITIPIMSFAAFFLITVLIATYAASSAMKVAKKG